MKQMGIIDSVKMVVLCLIIMTGFYYANAWTGPNLTQPAPYINVSAPINTSASSQEKIGPLFVDGNFGTFGTITAPQYCIGSSCITSWSGVGGGGIPAGAVMSFNLSSCPSGWKAADGTNGTPDLRGYFVRGLGTNSDGTVSDALGVKVVDEYRSHSHSGVTDGIETHTYSASDSKVQRGSADRTVLTSLSGAVSYPQSTLRIDSSGGSETRPKNIALLYCQKI